MAEMTSGAAVDLLRDMREKELRETPGMPENDTDMDAGWTSGWETVGEIDTGALPGMPTVRIAEEQLEEAVINLASAVGGVEKLTMGHVKGLMAHMYERGHSQGHMRGYKRAHRHMRDPGVKYGRSRRMNEFRGDIIQRYKQIHGGDIIEGPGFYYGTVEAQFSVENDGVGAGTLQASAVISVPNQQSPVIDKTFDLGIGDTSTSWLGGPHVITEADTNVQNPGQSLFADELFIVEAISARVRGAAIKYPAVAPGGAAVLYPQAATMPVTQTALAGQTMVWDENGELLPVELWNGLTDYYRLAHALAENSTVHFTWRDQGIGGSNTTIDALIDSFLHVPGSHEMNVRRTSGGNAEVLDLPQGYIWCLDKQFQASRDQGGNGLFDCELHLDENVVYPFVPIAPYGSTVGGVASAVAPTTIALYWEIRLLGTSLLPGRRGLGWRPEYRQELARRSL